MSDPTTPVAVTSPSSSTSTKANTSKVALKPNEYRKGLDQEHITRLTEDVYKHFAEYTNAELKSKVSLLNTKSAN